MDNETTLVELEQRYTFKSKEYCDLSPKEKQAVLDLITASGEVDTKKLAQRLEKNIVRIFIAKKGNDIIGLRAIKSPNSKYKQKIFSKAGHQELSDQYSLEIGYAFVDEKHRHQGIYSRLTDMALEEFPENLYTTTRQDNSYVIGHLTKKGFGAIGEYQSTRGDYKLILLTKTA